MKTIKLGIIGCGFMRKEFTGAVGRWVNLEEISSKAKIIAVCDTNPA